MYSIKRLLPHLLFMAAVGNPVVSVSDSHVHDHEHRQHGTHVHGVGQLNLALQDGELHMELHTPAANIVGFEHIPASEVDKGTLDQAVTLLRDGGRLFRFNQAAECRMEAAEISSPLLDSEHHAEETESHADIQATYHFRCTHPERLERLGVELFETFPGTERLHLQFVIGHSQGAAELTGANHVMEF